MKGLTDRWSGCDGQDRENVAHRFGITREQMDAFSVRITSGRHARRKKDGLAPGGGRSRGAVRRRRRDLPARRRRAGATRRRKNLAKLKPFFDRKYGNGPPATARRSHDGAAWMILASEEALRRTASRRSWPHRRLRVGGARPRADGS